MSQGRRIMSSMNIASKTSSKTSREQKKRSKHEGSGWMDFDWIDTCGVDLLGVCNGDHDCVGGSVGGGSKNSSGTFGDALTVQNVPPINSTTIEDFEALHDEFLESLLMEEAANSTTLKDDDPSRSASWILEKNSSSMSLNSAETNNIVTDEDDSDNETSRKRQRSVKLHRRTTPPTMRRGGNNKVAPLQESSHTTTAKVKIPQHRTHDDSANKSIGGNSAVNLADLSQGQAPDANTFLHPQCRMQKDKGKGEAVGSNICAKGRDACMTKLRTKMQLLTEIAFSNSDAKKGSATMKRRKARVSERCENFTETRSMIELKMGFLSMQYGVLLRWETNRTGRVTLVVLRKMCHGSFYPPKALQPFQQQTSPPYQARDVVGDCNAISHHGDETEVSLLEPPFHHSRPELFEPTVLSVAVLYAAGLSKRSNWTVQLSYGDTKQTVYLGWDPKMACLCPKPAYSIGSAAATAGQPKLKLKLPHAAVQDLQSLEIELFEHRLKRWNQRRLVSTMKVPLANLKPQPSVGGKPSRMKIPCQDDHDASIAIDLFLQSDYCLWFHKELEARRRQDEARGFMWRAPYFATTEAAESLEEDEDIENDPWQWICSVC